MLSDREAALAAQPLVKPLVHLNGDSRETLLRDNMAAYDAIQAAIKALGEAAPNGRNFYPLGGDAMLTAQAQHARRMARLQETADEIEQILLALG